MNQLVSVGEAFWRVRLGASRAEFIEDATSRGAVTDGRVDLLPFTAGPVPVMKPRIRVIGPVRL
jgi:hypothetical protein